MLDKHNDIDNIDSELNKFGGESVWILLQTVQKPQII